jgi:hypothetical protein
MLISMGKAWQGGAGCYRKITARSGGSPRTGQSAPLFRGRLASAAEKPQFDELKRRELITLSGD